MLNLVTEESILKLWEANFEDGRLKPQAAPLAQGTFASIFPISSLGEENQGEQGASNYILRVANFPAGEGQEFNLNKELQGLSAYLRINGMDGSAKEDQLVWISKEDTVQGLCSIYAYYVLSAVKGKGARALVTVMPRGKPLIDLIEEELMAAEGGEQKPRDLGPIVGGMSQLAVALKKMHDTKVYWRDCKVDNVVLIGDKANIIDINSGVCTVGYASHEQLVKLQVEPEAYADSQKITDALEQILADQPDHQTWVTQDVFALSIVVMEWLTYGMFTYPYNRDETPPSYVHLLLYELNVYNLLLKELSDIYDVSVLQGRLDRKIKHWTSKIGDGIDATSQEVRDLTLWPMAVAEFRKDRRLFDLWAALAFWDHVDHQFGFIGHWFEWYFDFSKHAQLSGPLSPAVPPSPESSTKPAERHDGEQQSTPMQEWADRAVSTDLSLIKARLQERSERIEQQEEDDTARVVKRLATLTQRMDSLNNSLTVFWDQSSGTPSKERQIPSVKVAYSNPAAVSSLLDQKEGSFSMAGAGSKLLEVRLRLRIPKDKPDTKKQVYELLGKPTT